MKVKSVEVAIDFGTACSGFAYVYTKDLSETILVQDKWQGGGTLNMKTITQIVLDKSRNFVAFGYEARDYYNKNDADPEEFPLFAFYKMHLFDHKNRAQPVKSINSSQTASAQELITETLRFFKKSAITKINIQSANAVIEDDIQWVLTIPAIWDDSSKQVMRNCADNAGLCSKDDKDSLIFSYEPECGALQCIFEKTSGYSVSVGNKIMVIDNGGGTSDIIAYKQLEGKKLMSISRSFGGNYGSVYVNGNFIKFLKTLFGNKEIESRYETSQFQLLMDSFESLKKSFHFGEPKSIKSLDLCPLALFKKDQEWLMGKINSYNGTTGSNVRYSDKREKLMLPFELFYSFFTSLFNSITDCVKSEIAANSDIAKLDYIFLIGGFNENRFLQEHIKRELHSTGAKVIVSTNPSLAVVTGAARFGLNPDTISKRKQTRSYATEIQEVVTIGNHVGKQFIKIGDVNYCPNVCDVFVHANQMVGYDETFTRSYMPTSLYQKSIEISIFSTHMPTMAYTTDPGIQFIGELFIVIPNPGLPVIDNRIDVTMKFASTEIEVIATHVKTGSKISHSFDFALDEAESLKRNKLHQEKNKPPKVQLCIMMDCTGSMGSWIVESKSKMIQLTKSLATSYSGLELNVGFVGYRDICDPDRFDIVPFTNDMPSLQTKIGSMVADGGGDEPEDIAGALKQAEGLFWKPGFTKLIVHVGDAPCHGSKYNTCGTDTYPDGDPSGLVPEKTLYDLSEKGVDYYFIKINSSTDQMIDVFRGSYDTPQKKIVVQDLGSDVSKLLPSLINFVTNSITRYNQ